MNGLNFIWRLALCCLATLPAATADDMGPETIHLVAAAGTVDTVISEVVLREAYGRLGYQVEIAKYPAERALRLADAGRVDGDVQRIDGLGKDYPNLIQLQPPINFIEGSVFSTGKPITVDGWSSLRGHSIGLIRGIKFAENNTIGMDRHLVGNYPALFKMLRNDRFNFIVSPRLNGLYQLAKYKIEEISPLEPAIARFDLYHYLHRNRADLVPGLEAVLREMQASGELAAIRDRVVTVLLRLAQQNLPLCDEDYACFEPSDDASTETEHPATP